VVCIHVPHAGNGSANVVAALAPAAGSDANPAPAKVGQLDCLRRGLSKDDVSRPVSARLAGARAEARIPDDYVGAFIPVYVARSCHGGASTVSLDQPTSATTFTTEDWRSSVNAKAAAAKVCQVDDGPPRGRENDPSAAVISLTASIRSSRSNNEVLTAVAIHVANRCGRSDAVALFGAINSKEERVRRIHGLKLGSTGTIACERTGGEDKYDE
jgi:hypothetical protein